MFTSSSLQWMFGIEKHKGFRIKDNNSANLADI